MNTPVAMLVFNRPELTERLFKIVAAQRPRQLLVVADGARPDRPGEADRCKAVREVFAKIDWPCELLTNFSDVNLGCRVRVSSGLDWVFQQVDRAIILEDDCLPDPSFFPFCQELLERYRDETRVMHITGNNFQPRGWTCPTSYYFSRYAPIWGWATWRRAWKLYDVNITRWPELKHENWLSDYISNPREVEMWIGGFDSVHSGGYDTWDHQWTFACYTNNGLSATPAVNLVTNLGFGPNATHTHSTGPAANLPTQPILFPLRHPTVREASKPADDYIFRTFLEDKSNRPGPFRRARHFARRMLSRVGLWR